MIKISVSTKKEEEALYKLIDANKEIKELICKSNFDRDNQPPFILPYVISIDKDMCEMCGSDHTTQNLHNYDPDNPDYPGGPVFKCYDCQYEVIRDEKEMYGLERDECIGR